jgi:hypothetical protein
MPVLFSALLIAPVAAQAQEEQDGIYQPGTPIDEPPQQDAPAYAPQQLDQMLAPIALYPDQLVGQILMASTYPLEVVEAYRWLQDPANAGLRDGDLAAAVEPQAWDPSVKALAAFPQVLKTMNDNLPWTEQLGDAFLADQAAVMDSVQRLRQQAQAAGTLRSTPQQLVSQQGPEIEIVPANPEVVYVPYYNPAVIYGDWDYPGYPPYYFSEYPSAGDALLFGLAFGVVDVLWGWDRFDWHHHRIDIDDRRFQRINRDRPPRFSGVWEHNPAHRRGVPYRSAQVSARFQGAAAASPAQRRVFRGFAATAPAASPEQRPAAGRVRENAGIRTETSNSRVTTPRERERGPETSVARPAVNAPETQRPSERPVRQAPAFTAPAQNIRAPVAVRPPEEAGQRLSPPLFESFSRGPEVRTQSARGFGSRSSPAPAAAPPQGRGLAGHGPPSRGPEARGPKGPGRQDGKNKESR